MIARTHAGLSFPGEIATFWFLINLVGPSPVELPPSTAARTSYSFDAEASGGTSADPGQAASTKSFMIRRSSRVVLSARVWISAVTSSGISSTS